MVVAAGLALAVGCSGWEARADNPLKLLPTPKVLKVDGGSIPLTAENRIVATDPKLKPLTGILSDEILLITKVRLATADDEPKAGDIVLRINPKLRADTDIWTVKGQDVVQVRDYAHTITVTDRTVVEGWDYRAVCEGTATLLQALQLDGDKVSVPKMTVNDWPHADFTGTMADCARQPNPAYCLKTVVEACRYYKVRYLHLHLSDDSAFTFPSKSHPDASRIHAPNVPPYTLEELNDLVAYADARGVTCVPELEAPGHCTALLDGMKGKLGSAHQRCMDVLNPDIYPILDDIVGDMCEVFKSSPYFHIGGDEVEPAWYKSNPHVQKYIKDNNITDDHYLFLPYGKNMAEICKKYGKKAVMWEGFRVGVPFDPSLANDIVVYAWYGGAGIAQNNGFATITVPWEVKIPFKDWSMYHCNGHNHDRTKERVLGASRPMWEVDGYTMAKPYMRGLPERQERTWGPDNVIEDDYHKNRMTKQSDRMEMITQPVKFAYAGDIKNGIFSEPVIVTMTAVAPDLQIRYRLDGKEPTVDSALYEKPFSVAESLRIRAALYDKAGKRVGNVALGGHLRYVGFAKSLSTGKPVETSGGKNGAEKAEYAADGWVDINKFWGTKPAPQWWKVDLEKEQSIDRVQVVPYFDGHRYYQYNVEVSTDGQAWKQVADASKNAEVGTEKGYTHKFEPVKARHVRVNMLKNSDNPAVHLVEVRVFEAGK
jgi:hexosaminidase